MSTFSLWFFVLACCLLLATYVAEGHQTCKEKCSKEMREQAEAACWKSHTAAGRSHAKNDDKRLASGFPGDGFEDDWKKSCAPLLVLDVVVKECIEKKCRTEL
eukprot:TRINITY_DN11510_c1_g1_i1.p3 TRINITY_DN11510_c1_g1~~TRINITY_DN11510_c1_g1_i1.p3  ORF type:complete len:103 (-),score=22.50 TRINITY_DN11510_c1_g1_i1:193-501(-)